MFEATSVICVDENGSPISVREDFDMKKFFKKQKKFLFGQVTMEFLFCMIIVVLFMFGFVQALAWIGITLAERRAAGDASLTSITAVEQWRDFNTDPSPLTQLNPNFYKPKKMKIVFDQW